MKIRRAFGELSDVLKKSHQIRPDSARLRRGDGRRAIEARLTREIEASKKEVIAEIVESEKTVVGEIRDATAKLSEEIQRAILQSAIRATQYKLKQLPAPPRDFIGREADMVSVQTWEN